MARDAKQYIRRYFEDRGLVYANKAMDAYLFLVSELGEVADAIVSGNADWVRNDPDKYRGLADELADVYMMLYITADLSGVDLDEALFDKMQKKCGIDYRKDSDEETIKG